MTAVTSLEGITELLGHAGKDLAPVSDPALSSQVTELLFTEAELLDEGRYQDWIELFEELSCYWVPVTASSTSPWESLNLIFDHRPQLEDRLYRYEIGTVWSQDPPSQTSRLLGNVRVLSAGEAGTWVARSRYVLIEARNNQSHTYSGRCAHVLVESDDGLRIAGKRVDLVNSNSYLPSLTFLL